jgi:hypothetical protein
VSNLAFSTSYTVNVTSGAKDIAGNGAIPFSSTLTTAAPPDVTPPTVTAVSPTNKAFDVSTSAQIKVTFNEPIDPATVTASTFTIKESNPTDPFLTGTRTYDAGTNTIVFTPSVALKNHKSYLVTVTPGIKDVAGNALTASSTTCFTPTAGAGAIISMSGFWSQTEACQDIHFHVPIIQTGNTLSLGSCAPELYCVTSAVSEAGKAYLGGASCITSPYPPPRICDVNVASLTGSVSGSAVTFTMTMVNGLTFTFNGTFAATGTANPFITGTISGTNMPLVGINFEREGN